MASSGLPVEFGCHTWTCPSPYLDVCIYLSFSQRWLTVHHRLPEPAPTHLQTRRFIQVCKFLPPPPFLQVLEPFSYQTVSGHSAVKEFIGWPISAVEIVSPGLYSLWYKSCALYSQHVLRGSSSLLLLALHSSREVPRRVDVVK